MNFTSLNTFDSTDIVKARDVLSTKIYIASRDNKDTTEMKVIKKLIRIRETFLYMYI